TISPANPTTSSSVTILSNELLQNGDSANGGNLFLNGADGAAPCSACHTISEERLVGPGLGDVYGRAPQADGYQSAEEYLYESIVSPSAVLVDGYTDVMPQNYGVDLTDDEIADLNAYLRSLD
ncbi:MAG: c-type cytochrome, partial [Chloroflexota bacterium]